MKTTVVICAVVATLVIWWMTRPESLNYTGEYLGVENYLLTRSIEKTPNGCRFIVLSVPASQEAKDIFTKCRVVHVRHTIEYDARLDTLTNTRVASLMIDSGNYAFEEYRYSLPRSSAWAWDSLNKARYL